MKMICVNNDNCKRITIGKVYNANGIVYPDIKDDNGVKGSYLSSRFITVEEYRNRKLTEIGI